MFKYPETCSLSLSFPIFDSMASRHNTQVTHTAWKVSVFRVFLVSIFRHSNWIRRYTEYLSVFSPNAGKYGPEKLLIRTLFTQCQTRRSHQRCSVKKGVLKNFKNSTGKRLCWSLFLIKLQAFRCFPVKFAKFLRTSKNIYQRLLLSSTSLHWSD